jgi:hypothetical protein
MKAAVITFESYLRKSKWDHCVELFESVITPVVKGDVFGQVKGGHLRTQGCRLASSGVIKPAGFIDRRFVVVHIIDNRNSETPQMHEIRLAFVGAPYH